MKAIIWNRYEVLSFLANQASTDDDFSFKTQGFSSATSKSILVNTISGLANTLSGDDYFIYSNNVEDTYLGGVNAPIICVIPSFSTLSDGNEIFSYQPETEIFCDLKNQSLNSFHILMTNSSGEKLVVNAFIDLKFRLKQTT